MNDHMGEKPSMMGRRRRRRLVTVAYFFLTVVALVFAFAKSERIDVAMIFLLVAFVFFVVQLLPVMQGLTQKKVSELDERELGVHGRAYFRAYRVLGVVCGLTLMYMALAATPQEVQMHYGTDFTMPTPSQFSFLGLFYTYLLISLPAAMVAWTEPDPSDLDED